MTERQKDVFLTGEPQGRETPEQEFFLTGEPQEQEEGLPQGRFL